jgi:hypothetical protein
MMGIETKQTLGLYQNCATRHLAGAMRRVGMTTDEILKAMLQVNANRCKPPLPTNEVVRVVENVAKYEPDQVAQAVAENHWGQLGAAEKESQQSDEPEDPGPFPEGIIERAPKIVQDCLEYYKATCVIYQPTLFLGSLLATTGAILGHKVKDVSGLRTNIYALGICDTGQGKEATREVPFRILRHAGVEGLCGPEDFASDAGLIAAVEAQNPILFQLDEFGRFMRTVNADGAQSPHLYNIASVLLKFYSKAGGVFRSKAYADARRNKTIEQPHVCIYGTTVPGNFWAALNVDSLEGGFLPRMLIFGPRKKPVAGDAIETDPPEGISQFFRGWANRPMGNGNLQQVYPSPIVVPFSADANTLMSEFGELQAEEMRKFGNLGVVWSRAVENAKKVAMVHACWADDQDPKVGKVTAKWAIRLTTHCIRYCVFMARYNLAEGAADRDRQKILREMMRFREEGIEEVRHRELTRRCRSLSRKRREEAIRDLMETGKIIGRAEQTSGRSATRYRMV